MRKIAVQGTMPELNYAMRNNGLDCLMNRIKNLFIFLNTAVGAA